MINRKIFDSIAVIDLELNYNGIQRVYKCSFLQCEIKLVT